MSLMGVLLELADGAQTLMGQFVGAGYDSEPLTTESLRATLVGVKEGSLTAQDRAREIVDLIADTEHADRIMSELTTLERVLEGLAAAADASMVGLDVIEPAVEAVRSSSGGLLTNGEGLAKIFDGFLERSDEVARTIERLQEAQEGLDELVSKGDGKRLGGGLSDVSRIVAELESGLLMAQKMVPIAKHILGAGGVRKYLVLGQSADELRATGGFVSGVWLVTFEDGALTDVSYKDSVSVDDWDRLMLYPKAPTGLEKHMNAWVWLLRDVSWDPDFPTTARGAEDMYRLGQRQEVDGVVAINQWTLLRLIEAMGAIRAPDTDILVTSRNLLGVLEEGTDEHGRAYMDLVFQSVLDRLRESIALPTLVRLASGIFETLEQRDTLLFFDDRNVQAVMTDLGWDGGVRQDPVDYIYVVDSNIGWNCNDFKHG